MKSQTNNVVSIAQNVNDELLEIVQDLLFFSFEEYEHIIDPKVDQFFEQFSFSKEEEEYLYPYFIWWMVFCDRGHATDHNTIYQKFLNKNRRKFRKKPLLERTLLKWQYVIPSFFYIQEMATKRIFRLFDLFDYREEKVVVISYETFKKPDSGDLLAGFVLPLAEEGGYFTLVEFLIIPDKIRAQLASKLISFYQSDLTISTSEFFSKHYPEMLKMTLHQLQENNCKIN